MLQRTFPALVVCLLSTVLATGGLVAAGDATIVPPEAFYRESGQPTRLLRAFEVPVAGSATLRIVIGAEDDQITGEDVSSSIVLLNGSVVVGPESFNQTVSLIETPVTLVAGVNALEVEVRGKPGGLLTVSILAPADRVTLEPVLAPVYVGGDPLTTRATVTALGIPVPASEVQFEVFGLGQIPSAIATTDASGMATAELTGFTSAGTGTLQASLPGSSPLITDWTQFDVLEIEHISIDQGLSSIELEVGSDRFLAFTVSLNPADTAQYHVAVSQSLTPDIGGVALSSDYPPGGWSGSSTQSWVVNEVVRGLAPGEYTLTTTATILETGEVDVFECPIVVRSTPPEPQLALHLPGLYPDGVATGETTEVSFSCMTTGVLDPPPQLTVQEVDPTGALLSTIGFLYDDGQSGDIVAGDGVYSGVFVLSGDTEGHRAFVVEGDHHGETVRSPEALLHVTRFPVGPATVADDDFTTDPASGIVLVKGEILVAFLDGVTPDRIEEIVAAVDGEVVGSIPSLGVLQVRVSQADAVSNLVAVLDTLRTFPEVEFAEANVANYASEVPPDEPYTQWNIAKIRADEAWVVARARNILVAVVDSGVDSSQPDLDGVVVEGYDFWNLDDDPMDDNGHGTNAAGIIAAKHGGSSLDQYDGITGVAWGARILAVKDRSAHSMGTTLHSAAAITYSAAKGAKVINMSFSTKSIWGISDAQGLLLNHTEGQAVRLAKLMGSLNVGAAGNDGRRYRTYPASFEEVIAVGATKNDDTRAWFSNYGSWIDIAAPGVSIQTTGIGTSWGPESGTSFSAPQVAGAAAVLWSLNPSWSAQQVRERLEKTAEPLPSSLQLGAGRLDLFEAVFNGSFETGRLEEWQTAGTVASLSALGPLKPTHGRRMAYASTGPAGDQVAAALTNSFIVQDGVTSFPVGFEYDFITEEYPEWVGSQFDDRLRIMLTRPDGTEVQLAVESVNGSQFSLISGIDFPGGDQTVGHTGWKTVSVTVPVTAGPGEYEIRIQDAGDDIYDSVVLIDNIRLR